MAEEAQPVAVETDASDIEADIDTVIAAFEGDIRAAIRALLIANEFLSAELERARETVSVGYVRGRHKSVDLVGTEGSAF